MLEKQLKRRRRHRRVRAKIKGTEKIPRLNVFRSANHIYAQLIDDKKGKIILSADDLKIISSKPGKEKKKLKKETEGEKGEKSNLLKNRKTAFAYQVGKIIAEKSIKKGIKKVVFDRGGYKYHGRIKAVAEGAREGGLKF